VHLVPLARDLRSLRCVDKVHIDEVDMAKKARVQMSKWLQQYEGLSPDVKAVIQPLAPVFMATFEDEGLVSDEQGLFMAASMYMDDPRLFYDIAAEYAATNKDQEIMENIFNSLDAAQRMAIEKIVNDDMLEIRDRLDLFEEAAAEQACVLKWTYEYCTNCEAFLSRFKELSPVFVVGALYLADIYRNIPGDKARFLVEHGDKSKALIYRTADVAELYLKDRAKFELQYDIVYAYAQSMARARQTCKRWRSVCNENTEEPYRFFVDL